jgi:hypothetical protein
MAAVIIFKELTMGVVKKIVKSILPYYFVEKYRYYRNKKHGVLGGGGAN